MNLNIMILSGKNPDKTEYILHNLVFINSRNCNLIYSGRQQTSDFLETRVGHGEAERRDYHRELKKLLEVMNIFFILTV